MTKLSIESMLPENRLAIYEMLQQTDMFTAAEINVAMELVDVYLFNKEQTDYIVDVAVTEEEEVVGYVCYGPTPATEGTFDLYWIVVSPAFQNQHIGKQLLTYVEENVVAREGRILIIETSSQPKYSPTYRFYIRNSYILEARIKDFYRIDDDRLILIKRFTVPSMEE